MNRRNTIATALAATAGWAISECIPRWAWRRSVAQGSDDYRTTVDFLPEWPNDRLVQVHDLEVEEDQVAGLAYHRASRRRVIHKNGLNMEVLYLEYEAGNPRYFEDLFYHPPERCMAAEGKVTASRLRRITVAETEVEIRCVTFREATSQRLLHVYKAVWLHRDFPVRMGADMHWRKVQSAMAFKPCPPARMLMAAVLGAQDETAAWELFHDVALSELRSNEPTES